jgi:hypothetical protein
LWVGGGKGGRKKLTQAEHNIEKDDQHHCSGIDEEACVTHPEWAAGHVLPSGEKVR